MKILISHDGSLAHYFERLGMARAFVACGHETTMWELGRKSEFDAFDDFEPDIFIGQTYNLNEALADCIRQRPGLKVYMKAADWGYKTEEISSKYPILVATDKEKEMVLKLKEQCNKPDFVCVHHHEDWISDTHGHWIRNGIPAVSIMNAADIFDYTKGEKQKKYECDVCMVGGYWGYKSIVLNEWLLPLCRNFDLNIKIFGNQPWPVPQYCGYIEDSEVKHALASAKVCVNLHEPHSHEYGYDVVERPFKLLSNKCIMVSDYVEGLYRSYPPDTLFLNRSPEGFRETIRNIVNHHKDWMKEAKENVEAAYMHTLKSHTYFDRVIKVFIELGLEEEWPKALAKKIEVQQKLGLI